MKFFKKSSPKYSDNLKQELKADKSEHKSHFHFGKPVFSAHHRNTANKKKSHPVHDMFKIATHKNTQEDINRSNANQDPNKVAEEHAEQVFRSQLKFPANLLSNSEASEFYRMGKSHQYIKKYSWSRIAASAAVFLICILIKAANPVFWIAGVIGFILMWILMGLGVRDSYKAFALKRQLHFDVFMSVLSPWLYRMNKSRTSSKSTAAGMSMPAILSHVSKQIDDKDTKHQVDLLNVDVQNDKTSFVPYRNFARRFSESGRAYMFMVSVYHMSQGAIDAEAIRSLNKNAMRDLLDKVHKIRIIKIKRFSRPLLILFLGWFLLLTYYFGLVMVKLVLQQIAHIHGV